MRPHSDVQDGMGSHFKKERKGEKTVPRASYLIAYRKAFFSQGKEDKNGNGNLQLDFSKVRFTSYSD
jgi:hypothetical protein